MPQASDHFPIHIDQELILERPEQAAHLALISVLWNRVEANVIGLLTAILPPPLLVSGGLIGNMLHDLVSLDIRMNMIRNAASYCLSDEMNVELEALLREVRDRARERVKYVHSEWHMSPDIPDGLVRIPRETEKKVGRPAAKMELYKTPDFVDCENRMKALSERLCKFAMKCVELRRPQAPERVTAGSS